MLLAEFQGVKQILLLSFTREFDQIISFFSAVYSGANQS
jgi:hypothetical protein